MDPVIIAAIIGGLVGGITGVLGSYIASKTLLIPYYANLENVKILEEQQRRRDAEMMPYLELIRSNETIHKDISSAMELIGILVEVAIQVDPENLVKIIKITSEKYKSNERDSFDATRKDQG